MTPACLPSVYSVPIYHRCIDGMSSVLDTEGNIPQEDFERKQDYLFSFEETESGRESEKYLTKI